MQLSTLIVLLLLICAAIISAQPFRSRDSSLESLRDLLITDEDEDHNEVALGVPIASDQPSAPQSTITEQNQLYEERNSIHRTVPNAPGMLAHVPRRAIGVPIVRDPQLIRQLQQTQGYSIVRQVSRDMIETIQSMQMMRNNASNQQLLREIEMQLEMKRLALMQGLRMAGLLALLDPFQGPIDYSIERQEQAILHNLQLIQSALANR